MSKYLEKGIQTALLIAFLFGANYVFAASTWQGATASPPGDNTDAPLTTSATAQYKEGALKVGSADSPLASALLELDANNKGFLPPRLTTTERDAISVGSIDEGLMIYNTDDRSVQYWDGFEWTSAATSSSSGGAGAGSGVPTGAIMFFASSCPDTWHEFEDLRGRYPVGVPQFGEVGAVVGDPLTDKQNVATGEHYHYDNAMYFHSYALATGYPSYPYFDRTTYSTGSAIPYSPDHDVSWGTNAPYIQLVACQKD